MKPAPRHPRPQVIPLLAGLALALAACAGVQSARGAAATNNPAKAADKKGTADKKGPGAKVEAATTVTNAPPKVVEIPKSVFRYKLGEGKDPFFPSSTRWQMRSATLPIPVAPPTNVFTNIPSTGTNTNEVSVIPVPDVPPISATFLLRATFIGKKPSAAINTGPATYDFFIGDEFVVRTREGISRVRCLDVKAGSAKISVDGEKEPRELKLRPDL